MLKDVQNFANQTLSLSMMPLEQWAKWTDDSQRQMKALFAQSKATQDEIFEKAIEEVKSFEQQTQSAFGKLSGTFKTVDLVAVVTTEETVASAPLEKAVEPVAPAAPVVQSEVEAIVDTVEPVVEAAVEAQVDDLTRISGVGPALAKKLNAAGYHTFAQIAALSDDAIDELESTVIRFSGRIARDDWKGQAARFIETE